MDTYFVLFEGNWICSWCQAAGTVLRGEGGRSEEEERSLPVTETFLMGPQAHTVVALSAAVAGLCGCLLPSQHSMLLWGMATGLQRCPKGTGRVSLHLWEVRMHWNHPRR